MRRYTKSETKVGKKQVKKFAKRYGITPWNKAGVKRYYLDEDILNSLIGLRVGRYRSGNVSSCYYTDENGKEFKVANARAWSKKQKVFIEGDTVYCTWAPYNANIAELVACKILSEFD